MQPEARWHLISDLLSATETRRRNTGNVFSVLSLCFQRSDLSVSDRQ